MTKEQHLDGKPLLFGGDLAIAPRKAMGRVVVVWQGAEFGARLYLRDGTEIVIWDERPNRPPCRGSGRVESEQEIDYVSVRTAINLVEQIYGIVETINGETSEMTDADFAAVIAKLTLFVSSPRAVLGYEVNCPPRTRMRSSQKILDGGEDMTL